MKKLLGEETFFENTSNSEDNKPSLKYNTELLNYAGILEVKTDFTQTTFKYGIAIILVIMIVSIIMLYTAFKLTYSERIKEFGMLSSIGMDKKQKKSIIKTETKILGTIDIITGIFIGLVISKFLTSVIDILLKNYVYDMFHLVDTLLLDKPDFYMKVPILIFIIIIVYIVIVISSRLSLKKLNKLSPIAAIKGISSIKTSPKQLELSNMIEKLFGIEGIIANKNIKRDKSKYRTISLSLTVSIILFLSISGLSENFYKSNFYGGLLATLKSEDFADCEISFVGGSDNQKDIYKVVDYLNENELIDDYCSYSIYHNGIGKIVQIQLTESQTSNEVKEIISDGLFGTDENGSIYFPVTTVCYYDNAYNTMLKKAGINHLADDEVILMDTIKDKSKHGNKFRLTNYKVGDSYTLIMNNTEKTFRIAGIIEDFSPYILSETYNGKLSNPSIVQMVNKNNIKEDDYIYLALDTYKLSDIQSRSGEIANIAGASLNISKYQNMAHSLKVQKEITNITINCFIVLLTLVSFVNIFNTISSSILLRKKDFAILKSIGMSKRKLNKMMFIEGILYGIDSLFYGIIISIAILFVSYPNMNVDMNLFPFTIPWLNIFICIITVYIIIFISIQSAKSKFINKNIIDEIRQENI